jgi:predicted HicB family RNase H-like nuclease
MATKNVNVRIPDELHARIKRAAEQDRRSLNAEILHLAERGLDEEEAAQAGSRKGDER